MKIELWGTFSVRDHLRKRPFVAEVLLYDRLMIPRPTMPEEEKLEPGEENQFARWSRRGWEPERLREFLDILREGDLAVELPWGKQERQDWGDLYHVSGLAQIGAERAAMAQAAKSEIELAKTIAPDQAPYIATSGLISAYIANQMQNDVARRLLALAKTPGVPIEPVIAYGAYQEFQNEQLLQPADSATPPEGLTPYAMFGWEFFVPEDSGKSDHELLRESVRLASRPDFRETRQSFHGWLKQMHDGGVDPETARAEMLKMLEEYRAIVRGSGLNTALRYAAKAAPVLAPLAGLVSPDVGVGMGVAAGGAALIVEWLAPKRKPDERIRPAALVYDARCFFGKK
jgi:hypothetical protein